MIIYRYEKEDGGGPFCELSGENRMTNERQDDGFLYGCLSIESLNNYFKNQKEIIKDCVIKEYSVPINEVIIEQRQVRFPKRYKY